MANETGNVYSVTGWYTPTKYGKRSGASWATGKNTAPDMYTKQELRTHYDFVHNNTRANKPLPSDSDKLRYDWVYNIRSKEGRWQLHNPNGLNAHRDGMDPYDWKDEWTKERVGSVPKSRTIASSVQDETFDAAFQAARAAADKKSQEQSDPSSVVTISSLWMANANRNAMMRNALDEMASTNQSNALEEANNTLLRLMEDEDDKDKKASST